MKKIIGIVLAVCILMCTSFVTQAKTVINEDMGIAFALSDSWIDMSSDDMITFSHSTNSDEYITVVSVITDWAYDLSFADESSLKSLCEEMLSDAELSSELTEVNGVYVSVTTNYVNTSYLTFGTQPYYKYEKSYHATAYGYNPVNFYDALYVTAANGNAYMIRYSNNGINGHTYDFQNMMNSINFSSGEIKIFINGARIYPDTAPIAIDGRTLVPIRAVAEKMGYSVGWDADTQSAVLTSANGKNNLRFTLLSEYYTKNNKQYELDVPAIALNGRTYLPLRAVTEAMSANVNWNGNNNAVEITY